MCRVCNAFGPDRLDLVVGEIHYGDSVLTPIPYRQGVSSVINADRIEELPWTLTLPANCPKQGSIIRKKAHGAGPAVYNGDPAIVESGRVNHLTESMSRRVSTADGDVRRGRRVRAG